MAVTRNEGVRGSSPRVGLVENEAAEKLVEMCRAHCTEEFRVLVRRRFYRGSFRPPKSRYGRRDAPVSPSLAQALWELRKQTPPADAELVFQTATGRMVDPSNLMSRVLKPASRAAGIGGWPGFHTLRHSCATALFRQGLNAKQAQVWLGHHSPSFTLDVYVHLLPDDLPESPFGVPTAPPAVEAVEPEQAAALALSY